MNLSKDVFMYALTALMVVAVVIIVGLMIFYPVPEHQADTIKAVLVSLSGGVLVTVNYWFGSSKGSADKTEIISGKATDTTKQ